MRQGSSAKVGASSHDANLGPYRARLREAYYRMHNAFRRARRAGGKGEIAHFIGIFVALGHVVF